MAVDVNQSTMATRPKTGSSGPHETIRPDVLVCGGGAIGLAIAYQLSKEKQSVLLIDRAEVGKQTSWAAAGILPPAGPHPRDALDQLRRLSWQRLPEWVSQLQRDTGIDIEYHDGGGIHLAGGEGEAAALAVEVEDWRAEGIQIAPVPLRELVDREPCLAGAAKAGRIHGAYWLPQEATLRTPRYLAALAEACRRNGVQIWNHCDPPRWERTSDGQAVATVGSSQIVPNATCLTSGSWTRQVAAEFGIQLDIQPYRGQVLLIRSRPGLIRSAVLNEGPRYLVPRRDGLILIGSTVEDVGFDLSTTDQARDELMHFGCELVQELSEGEILSQWAGLRPRSGDGWPFLGWLPGQERVIVAAGHFRNGISLSAGTARLVSQMIEGQTPDVDLTGFRLERK